MYAIVAMAEFISAGLVVSTIAWLRHLYGASPLMHDFAIRYVVPVLVPILVVSLILLGVGQQQSGEFDPESSPTAACLAFGLGVVLAGVLAWLVVEVRRFRARRGPNYPFS